MAEASEEQRLAEGSPGEIFSAFLKLGLTSFGGPIAHLGYFREAFVVKRKWIDDAAYADLVALCQFMPGPASSQVGFSLGLLRGGPLGAFLAWLAFTLPSAAVLVAFAYGSAAFSGPLGAAFIHGLKIVAVAVVVEAVWGMARNLCPDRTRATIAVVAVLIVVFSGSAIGQVGAIVLGGLAGYWLCRDGGAVKTEKPAEFSLSRRTGIIALILFFVLLFGLPIVAGLFGNLGLSVFDAFFRSGSLVFGGGHVVLPLLEAEVVPSGWLSNDQFLAGYGAAQAVPGPLFTFSAYLGAAMAPGVEGLVLAAIALVGIFLPGFLLVVGALPFWNVLRAKPQAQAILRGANAAVVGILGAALYDPVWTSAILEPRHFALALIGITLLMIWKLPSWVTVIAMAAGSVAMYLVIGG